MGFDQTFAFFNSLSQKLPLSPKAFTSFKSPAYSDDQASQTPSLQTRTKNVLRVAANPPPLPVEIIIMIFESEGMDRNTWESCAQVCKTWAWIARMFLNRHVNLTTDSKLALFKHSIVFNPNTGYPLPQIVRGIEILVDLQARSIDLQSAVQLLSLCPNVVELRLLWGGCTIPLSPKTVGSLSAARLLTALFIDLRFVYMPNILYEIISLLPSLTVLGIEGQHLPHAYTLPIPSEPSPRLHELTLQHLPPWNCINWLLSRSKTSLKVLDLGRSPISPPIMKTILNTYGQHLISLAATHWDANDHAQVLSSLFNIDELIFRTAPAPACLAAIPKTVRHLAFDYYNRRSLYLVVDMINQVSKSSPLETITYPYARNDKEIDVMQQVCAGKGIKLRGSQGRLPSVLAQRKLYETFASPLLRER